MISGVRASSMRMLSASSTRAKKGGPCTGFSLDSLAMAQHAAQKVALALGNPPQQQAVAEEVEAELLGRAVGHVALVVLAAVVPRHLRLDHAHGHAQGAVDRPHPVGVAAGEVVVHRGQMAALAQQGVEIHGQRGGQRLAFAGLHLGDGVVEHGDAAEKLHVEVPHVERPPARLAHQGIGFDQQVGERLAAFRPIAERKAALAELVVAELRQLRFQAPIRGTSFSQRDIRKGFACREIDVNGELMKSMKLFTRVEGAKGGYVYYSPIGGATLEFRL